MHGCVQAVCGFFFLRFSSWEPQDHLRPVNQLMGLVNTHVRTAWETWTNRCTEVSDEQEIVGIINYSSIVP